MSEQDMIINVDEDLENDDFMFFLEDYVYFTNIPIKYVNINSPTIKFEQSTR